MGEAGCGKTEVLANIVVNLLKTKKAKDIVVLAYTHSAVNNLRERIKFMMNKEFEEGRILGIIEEVDCKTLHSYLLVVCFIVPDDTIELKEPILIPIIFLILFLIFFIKKLKSNLYRNYYYHYLIFSLICFNFMAIINNEKYF